MQIHINLSHHDPFICKTKLMSEIQMEKKNDFGKEKINKKDLSSY